MFEAKQKQSSLGIDLLLNQGQESSSGSILQPSKHLKLGRSSAMFTNTMINSEHGFSETNFVCKGTFNGYFLFEEAFQAISALL